MSVKVGVRVRPFNQRENDLNCRLCVEMIGPMTRLFDADDHEKHRDFTFDYSFWSHDQFYANEKGYLCAQGDKYADQQQVFEKVGLQILSNAWQGYHCCLFAYGQTGSGKSYSMVGYGANKGIVPISCEQIFNRIANNDDKNKQYQVNVSMLEIYNEKVQDLLIPISKRQKQGYKIRQHKTLGIYVEGLSKHYVDTYKSVEKKMEQGGRNRSIAATEMNACSSRAHTIISIQFKQIQLMQGKKREKLSVIHLVDLAGSEKVGKTGATGDRLKQAAGINKSLSVLGLVISTLADKAMGKGKNIIVPYRDSCLTRILQNALGGNSKTLMICAISPATDNYEETMSTLRYADQAKKIQNKAVINESQTDKIIRSLTAQKEQLREKMQRMEEMFNKLSKGLNLTPQMLSEFQNTKEEIRFNTEIMDGYSMSKKDKLKYEETQVVSELNKVELNEPHLSNLNADPQLSRLINYSINKQRTTIGRRNMEPPNDIQIGGMGIRKLHAIIDSDEDGNCYFEEIIQQSGQKCYLNGTIIEEKIQLRHLDRISFNTNNFFLVMIPQTEPRQLIREQDINWEFAQQQRYFKNKNMEDKQLEQKQKKLREGIQQIIQQKQKQLLEMKKSLQESEFLRMNMQKQKQTEKAEQQKIKIEEKAIQLQKDIENSKKQIKDSDNQKNLKIKEKYSFERKLMKALPKCIELNLIAKQFKRDITFTVKVLTEPQSEQLQHKKNIKIKVSNKEIGYCYWWDIQKLSNQYYAIKDLSDTYFSTGLMPTMSNQQDPFWDTPEPTLIGRGFLTTKALAYMFDNPIALPLIGDDDHCGELVVNLVPTDDTGVHNLCQEMDQQVEYQPQQLLGKPFYFNVIINEAKIPLNYRKIFVEYSLKVNQYKTKTFTTSEVENMTNNPQFNYNKLHSFQKITELLLNYLTTSKIIFGVYGCEMVIEEIKEIKLSDPVNKTQITKNSQTQITKDPENNGPDREKKALDTTKQKNKTTKTKQKLPMEKKKPIQSIPKEITNVSSNVAKQLPQKSNKNNTIPKQKQGDCQIF